MAGQKDGNAERPADTVDVEVVYLRALVAAQRPDGRHENFLQHHPTVPECRRATTSVYAIVAHVPIVPSCGAM